MLIIEGKIVSKNHTSKQTLENPATLDFELLSIKKQVTIIQAIIEILSRIEYQQNIIIFTLRH